MLPSALLPYSPSALQDLDDRTHYEAWLLEAVYEITDDAVSRHSEGELIFPPCGGEPSQLRYMRGASSLGDWRGHFLEKGAPLVFVTGFKLLDMLLEWVLKQNGHVGKTKKGKTHPYTLVEKIDLLDSTIRFPPPIEQRSWLRERIIALYAELRPLRNTVIHERHFTSDGGSLQISSSKDGIVAPAISVSPTELRSMAVVLISLLHYLRGSRTIDAFQEKVIRHVLDDLTSLHKQPSLGQLRPLRLTVQIHVEDRDPIEVDLRHIRSEVRARIPGEDAILSLRIVTLPHEGKAAEAFLVPWDQLQGTTFVRTRADLSTCSVAVP
jgi:hypothetical protein